MSKCTILIGTQGEGAGQGIWLADFDSSSGCLSSARLAATVERPTWLMRHPQRPVIYAVSEVGNRDARDGKLHALRVVDGTLEPLNNVSAHGGGPTDLALDAAGNTLFVANFGGGQASAIPLADDGSLESTITQCQHKGSGPHKRQAKPHPHGVTLDPSSRFLLVPDMGADKLFVHRFESGSRTIFGDETKVIALPAGSGPRLLRFSPDGGFAYLLTELSAQLFTYRVLPDGHLQLIQTLALDPAGHDEEPSAAALALSEDGRHLYASNRRTHEIHVFAIDAATGLLEPVQAIASGGERPWCVTLSPDGTFLIAGNQASDRVCVFRREVQTGLLTSVEGGTTSVPMPTCVIFV